MKLYVTDLDGTLLRQDKSMSDYTINTINTLIHKGYYFTIATARSFSSAKKILEPLNLKLPIILNNGGFIYDPVTKKNLVSNYMPNDLTKEIIQESLHRELNPIVHLENEGANQLYYSGLFNPGEKDYYNSRIKAGDQRFKKIKDYTIENKKIITIFYIGEFKTLNNFYTHLKKTYKNLQFHLFLDVYSNHYWLEINSIHATKKNGINFLREHLNIDEVSCFGDNLNDLSMFEASNYAYAVANAHDEIKKIALEIIDDNENDGVVKFIEGEILG